MAHMIKVSDSSVREIIGGKIKTADGTVSTIVGGKIRTSDTSVKSIEFWKYKYELVASGTKTNTSVQTLSIGVPADTVAVYSRVEGWGWNGSVSKNKLVFYAAGYLRNGTFCEFSYDTRQLSPDTELYAGHFTGLYTTSTQGTLVSYKLPTSYIDSTHSSTYTVYALRAHSPVWTNGVLHEGKDEDGEFVYPESNWFMFPFILNESNTDQSFHDFTEPSWMPFRDVNGIWWNIDNFYNVTDITPSDTSQNGDVSYKDGAARIWVNGGSKSRHYPYSRLTIG